LWLTVLGPVRAWLGDQEIELGAPQQRAVLAVLLAGGGQPVGISEIVDAIWGEEPPNSAVNAVHRSVGVLRRALQPGLPARVAGRWLSRSAGGYRLDMDADTTDLLRFRGQMAAARAVLAHSPPDAVTLLVEALDLWQGPAANGLSPGLRGTPSSSPSTGST